MTLSRRITILLCGLTFAAIGTVKAQKSANIYAFGFAGSFSDSLVYLTDIQQINGAKIAQKSNYLLYRDQYSQQLKQYLESGIGLGKRTCAIFYSTKRAKAEKMFVKMKKRYENDNSLIVKYLGADRFTFKPVVNSVSTNTGN